MSNNQQIQLIVERVRDLFPHLEIKDTDLELQRARIMRDFFYSLLPEYEIGIDHITKVQICQDIDADDEMIPSINLMCCINSVFPGPSVGIFGLIIPTPNFLWKKIDSCIRYYDFSDSVISALYDRCDNFISSKKRIKQFDEGLDELNVINKDDIVRINKERQVTSELEAAITSSEENVKERIDERRAMEHKIQEAIAKKEMLLRRKQLATASLDALKRKLDSKRNNLNRSFDCDGQITELDKLLLLAKKDKGKKMALLDEEKKSNREINNLRENLANRCASAEEILKDMAKIKVLEELKKKKVHAKTVNSAAQGLDEINNEISKIKEEHDQLLKSNTREIDQLQNAISRKREFEDNKYKLEKLKNEVKDVHTITANMNKLNEKEAQIRISFQNEEKRLKLKEEAMVNIRQKECEFYKAACDAILKDLDKFD